MRILVLSFLVFFSGSLTCQVPYQSDEQHRNDLGIIPVFKGEYPDPTVLRDGNDFYMTHTSLNNYPGLLIWHSTDLVNWRPVSFALTKNIGEIWAPDLCKYNGKYYIYFPARDYNSTMVVTAARMEGPWSDPVELKISHIDPGHVVGEDGKRYLYFSDGHVVQLSDDGLSTVGKVRQVYGGWKYPSDWLTECFCLESPKLFRRGRYFYLVSAQGGTAGPPTSHMAVVARSKSVLGPWENSPYNPLVHTFDYRETWWSRGHATLVDDPDGHWWMVYHAYLNNFRTLGRMTLLEPVEWTSDGWPVALNGNGAKGAARKIGPPRASVEPARRVISGFSHFEWQAYDGYEAERYAMNREVLEIRAKGQSLVSSNPYQFTPGHQSYRSDVRIEPRASARAGFTLFYGPKFYRGLEVAGDSIALVTEKRTSKVAAIPVGSKVHLRILNDHQAVALYYSFDGYKWESAWDAADVSPYTANLLGGFRSLKIALYAYGEGAASFSGYTYEPLSE